MLRSLMLSRRAASLTRWVRGYRCVMCVMPLLMRQEHTLMVDQVVR